MGCPGQECWDGGNGFGVWALKAPVTESVEMALSLSAGGPLPRLTLLEAESDSLVQFQLKIWSF